MDSCAALLEVAPAGKLHGGGSRRRGMVEREAGAGKLRGSERGPGAPFLPPLFRVGPMRTVHGSRSRAVGHPRPGGDRPEDQADLPCAAQQLPHVEGATGWSRSLYPFRSQCGEPYAGGPRGRSGQGPFGSSGHRAGRHGAARRGAPKGGDCPRQVRDFHLDREPTTYDGRGKGGQGKSPTPDPPGNQVGREFSWWMPMRATWATNARRDCRAD